MKYKKNFFLLGFLLVNILIAGCTSIISEDNPSNHEITHSDFRSAAPHRPTPEGVIKTPEETRQWTQTIQPTEWFLGSGYSSVVLPDGSIVLTGGRRGNYATRYNDVWRSTDEGATWVLVNASAGWETRGAQNCVVTPDGSIILMGGDGSRSFLNDTWRSADKGVTWTLMNRSSGWSGWPERMSSNSIVLSDGSIILFGGWSGMNFYWNDTWRSTDEGATWNLVNASARWPARSDMNSVVMPDGNIILMGGGSSRGFLNDTWRSTDEGATWTLMNASAGWSAREEMSSVAMPDGSIILMGGNDKHGYKPVYLNDTWRSTDEGATWTLMNASAGWSGRQGHNTVVMPDGSIVLMGGWDSNPRNDVWRSTDMGATWTQIAAGTGSH